MEYPYKQSFQNITVQQNYSKQACPVYTRTENKHSQTVTKYF